MKFREILLAILIIGLGVLIYYGKTGRIDLIWDGSGFLLGAWDPYEFEETQVLPGPLPAEVQVSNAHGSVAIQGTDTDKVTVTFKKVVYRKSKEAAQKDADLLKMTVSRDGTAVRLATNREDFKRRNFETHFTVSVPAKTAVRVRNSYGLVKTIGTGPTEIENPHGEVRALEIAGALTVKSTYAEVTIRGVEGDVRLTCPHVDLTVAEVGGECVIEHRYGDIRVEKAARKVTIDGSHSDISGIALSGEVYIENSYEPIVLRETGPATVRAHHSDIRVFKTAGKLDIRDQYSRIDIDGVQGDLAIDAPNSEISAEAVTAAEISIGSSYKAVALRGFTGHAVISTSHGDLVLEPAGITGPIDVQGTYASVRLIWPAGARIPFEGQTKNGQIFWALADRPTLETTNGQSVTKAFQDETGKPAIRITTSYGDIRVEEARRPLVKN
jgi:hypothetical protein